MTEEPWPVGPLAGRPEVWLTATQEPTAAATSTASRDSAINHLRSTHTMVTDDYAPLPAQQANSTTEPSESLQAGLTADRGVTPRLTCGARQRTGVGGC
jgi:hypothetical protein